VRLLPADTPYPPMFYSDIEVWGKLNLGPSPQRIPVSTERAFIDYR
jgi:hypothetical protein